MYGFEKAADFLNYSNEYTDYISLVVLNMLFDNVQFQSVEVSNYKDWGTELAYNYYINQGKTTI